MTLDRDQHTTTFRGLGESSTAMPVAANERTRTLTGLGFTSRTLRGLGETPAPNAPPEHACPGCRAKADAISGDLSCLMGVALALVKGAEAARGGLCTMHARLFRLLVDELTRGPRRAGDASWDD